MEFAKDTTYFIAGRMKPEHAQAAAYLMRELAEPAGPKPLKPLTHFFGGLMSWGSGSNPLIAAYQNEAAQKHDTFYLQPRHIGIEEHAYVINGPRDKLEQLAAHLQDHRHLTVRPDPEEPIATLYSAALIGAVEISILALALPEHASFYIEAPSIRLPIERQQLLAAALVRLVAEDNLHIRVGSTCYPFLWTTQQLMEGVFPTGPPGTFDFKESPALTTEQVACYLCLTDEICKRMDIATLTTGRWVAQLELHLRHTLTDMPPFFTYAEACIVTQALHELKRKPPIRFQILYQVEQIVDCANRLFRISDEEVFLLGKYLAGLTEEAAIALFDKVDIFWGLYHNYSRWKRRVIAHRRHDKTELFRESGLILSRQQMKKFTKQLIAQKGTTPDEPETSEAPETANAHL